MKEEWIDLLYQDKEEGELFFVEIKIDPSKSTREKRKAAAHELERLEMNESDYDYIGEYTCEEAEILGYDTY